MSRPSPTDVAAVLSKRAEVLATVDDRPRSKSEIGDAVGVSRSTVDRAIDELVDVGVVERSPPDGYRTTELGRLLLTARRAYLGCIEGVYDAAPIESHFPTGDRGECVMFDGASVVRPKQHVPDRPLQHLLDLVETADRCRLFSPVVLGRLVESCHDRLVDERLDLELVVTDAVTSSLRSRYPEKFPTVLELADVYRYSDGVAFPYGLGTVDVGDRRVAVMILCSRNGIGQVLENESNVAVGWASRLYEEAETAARPVRPERI